MVRAARSLSPSRTPSRIPLLEPLEQRTLFSIVTAAAVVVAHGDTASVFVVSLDRGRVTGTVTFTDGGSTTYGTVPISDVRISTAFVGTATIGSLRLPIGGHTIVATYNGDSIHASSHATAHPVILPASIIALGAAPGQHGIIHVLDFNNGLSKTLQPFGNFNGAVNVAAGDVNGDTFPDLVVSIGSGGPPLVEVIDFRSGHLLKAFFAFDPAFTGGVNVALGDVNSDAHDDIIVGMASSGSQVREYSGANGSVLSAFTPFGAFNGGARVTAGDVNGDGQADVVVTTGPGATIFSLFLGDASTAHTSRDFGGGAYHGGGFASIGDFDRSGINGGEITVSFGANSAPVLQVFQFDHTTPFLTFLAYPNNPTTHSGVYSLLLDVNRDGEPDIITNLAGSNVITVTDGHTHIVNSLLSGLFNPFRAVTPGFPLSGYDQALTL